MQRCLAVIACSLAFVLTGATAPVFITTPSVVVYPLIGNGGIDSQAGPDLAVLIANQIAQLGGVTVKPPPPGTEQRDYLVTARKLGVDYYVSGYVTTVGDQISLVEQLVSAYSGSVVWSTTAEVQTVGDAAGQGGLIRTAIINHAGRAYASLDTQSPTGPATGRATPGPNEANLRIGGGGGGGGARPAPKAPAAGPKGPAALGLLPAPRPTGPTGPKIAVLQLGGPANPSYRAYAELALVKALRDRGYNAALAGETTQKLALLGTLVCAKTGAAALIGGSVDATAGDPAQGAWTTAKVALTRYDCASNHVVGHAPAKPMTGWRWQAAIDDAIAASLKGYAVH